jgi:hypothetical protein
MQLHKQHNEVSLQACLRTIEQNYLGSSRAGARTCVCHLRQCLYVFRQSNVTNTAEKRDRASVSGLLHKAEAVLTGRGQHGRMVPSGQWLGLWLVWQAQWQACSTPGGQVARVLRQCWCNTCIYLSSVIKQCYSWQHA